MKNVTRHLLLLLCMGAASFFACEKKITPTQGMIYLTGGEFMIGGKPDPIHHHPLRKVRVQPFEIDRLEVTNADYELCVRAGKCKKPEFLAEAFSEGNQPVVKVSFKDATSYCAYAGKVLPTEIQWEYAARSTEGWAWPNGPRKTPSDSNTFEYPGTPDHRFTLPVAQMQADYSPWGVIGMTGNVSEITRTPYQADHTEIENDAGDKNMGNSLHVARGGNFHRPLSEAKSFYRHVLPDGNFSALWLGFRCAKEISKETK